MLALLDGSISLKVFPAVPLVGLSGREPVAEGDVESVQGGLPPDRPPFLSGPGRVEAKDGQVEAFSAACSVGKWPRAFIARRNRALMDSIALAVQITARISRSKSKKGMNSAQAFSHSRMIAG